MSEVSEGLENSFLCLLICEVDRQLSNHIQFRIYKKAEIEFLPQFIFNSKVNKQHSNRVLEWFAKNNYIPFGFFPENEI